MRLTARYYAFFSSITGKLFEPVDLEGNATVRDLIETQARRYGFKFRELCFIHPLYSDRDYLNICLTL